MPPKTRADKIQKQKKEVICATEGKKYGVQSHDRVKGQREIDNLLQKSEDYETAPESTAKAASISELDDVCQMTTHVNISEGDNYPGMASDEVDGQIDIAATEKTKESDTAKMTKFMETIAEQMVALRHDIKGELIGIRSDLEKQDRQYSRLLASLKEDVALQKQTVTSLGKEVEDLRTFKTKAIAKINELDRQAHRVKMRNRSWNFRILGVQEEVGEDPLKIAREILASKQLVHEPDDAIPLLDVAHRTGRTASHASSQNTSRHIVVKATKRETAQWIIMKSKPKNGNDVIKIFPDKTQLEQEAYKRAMPQIKEAKRAGIMATITRNEKLIIDGVETNIETPKNDWWR